MGSLDEEKTAKGEEKTAGRAAAEDEEETAGRG
jgi:hypothetical protein